MQISKTHVLLKQLWSIRRFPITSKKEDPDFWKGSPPKRMVEEKELIDGRGFAKMLKRVKILDGPGCRWKAPKKIKGDELELSKDGQKHKNN